MRAFACVAGQGACGRSSIPAGIGGAGPVAQQMIGSGFRQPDFPRAAHHLTHVRVWARQCQHINPLGARVEAHQCVGAPFTEPDDVLTVYEYRVRMRIVAGQSPFAPSMRRRIEYADFSCVPLADPDAPLRIGPYTTRALIRCRRLDDPARAAPWVDAAEIASRA